MNFTNLPFMEEWQEKNKIYVQFAVFHKKCRGHSKNVEGVTLQLSLRITVVWWNKVVEINASQIMEKKKKNC